MSLGKISQILIILKNHMFTAWNLMTSKTQITLSQFVTRRCQAGFQIPLKKEVWPNTQSLAYGLRKTKAKFMKIRFQGWVKSTFILSKQKKKISNWVRWTQSLKVMKQDRDLTSTVKDWHKVFHLLRLSIWKEKRVGRRSLVSKLILSIKLYNMLNHGEKSIKNQKTSQILSFLKNMTLGIFKTMISQVHSVINKIVETVIPCLLSKWSMQDWNSNMVIFRKKSHIFRHKWRCCAIIWMMGAMEERHTIMVSCMRKGILFPRNAHHLNSKDMETTAATTKTALKSPRSTTPTGSAITTLNQRRCKSNKTYSCMDQLPHPFLQVAKLFRIIIESLPLCSKMWSVTKH